VSRVQGRDIGSPLLCQSARTASQNDSVMGWMNSCDCD